MAINNYLRINTLTLIFPQISVLLCSISMPTLTTLGMSFFVYKKKRKRQYNNEQHYTVQIFSFSFSILVVNTV